MVNDKDADSWVKGLLKGFWGYLPTRVSEGWQASNIDLTSRRKTGMIVRMTGWLSQIAELFKASKWGFPEIGVPPVIIHFGGIVPYKPTILGIPHLWSIYGTPQITIVYTDGWLFG